MSKSNTRFDEHGQKIPSAHSPIRVGNRAAGPRGELPHWHASLAESWTRIEARDARRRVYDDARTRGEIITPEVAKRRVIRALHEAKLPFTLSEASAA